MTKRQIERLGYQVTTARNAQQALAVVREQVPDIVVLDLNLPDMTGCELCTVLKRQPALSRCRFVAYSGVAEQAHRITAQKAGFDAYLLKPATAEQLVSGGFGDLTASS